MDQMGTIAVVVATFVAAGIVKGVTGMGLPTVAMAVLGSLLSPLAASGLLLVPSFMTNVWQLFAGRGPGAILRRLWPMMAGVVFGTLFGSIAMVDGDTAHATMPLGGALLVYAACALFASPFRVPPRLERWLSPLVGLITGLVTGATGVFVIPAVPYLQALDLERDDLVQALGLSFTISTVALGVGLFWHGGLPAGGWAMSVGAVLPAMAGMAIGQALRARISPSLFRRGFLICLSVLGLEMLLRPLL